MKHGSLEVNLHYYISFQDNIRVTFNLNNIYEESKKKSIKNTLDTTMSKKVQ